MKTLLALVIGLLVVPGDACAQGTFLFTSESARTRVGSPDGPLAGRGIWAQALVGSAPDNLVPIDIPIEHIANGLIPGRTMTLPGVLSFETVYVQLAAWSGVLWGTNFSAVPVSQLGHTDVVPVYLWPPLTPPDKPKFTQPAIVPIPEPGAAALMGLGLALVALGRYGKAAWRARPGGP